MKSHKDTKDCKDCKDTEDIKDIKDCKDCKDDVPRFPLTVRLARRMIFNERRTSLPSKPLSGEVQQGTNTTIEGLRPYQEQWRDFPDCPKQGKNGMVIGKYGEMARTTSSVPIQRNARLSWYSGAAVGE